MSVYITASGRHLPGPAIDNEHIEAHLGLIHGKRSRLKARILKSNGIQTRHYAIDSNQQTYISNSEMAARAALACLERRSIPRRSIGMLSCATSQGDLLLPGFGSMVQAELALPAIELHTSHGICSSSMMALKAAYRAVAMGEHNRALVVASEFSSRLFKASRFEAAGGSAAVDFNSEFLRWMLSDGAGAVLLEAKPVKRSFRIEWIRSFSHADAYPVCMSVGMAKSGGGSWQDYPNYSDAERAGALLMRQDVRLLDNIVKLGVDGFLRLIDEQFIRVNEIDHVLCHYSSNYFRGKIFQLMRAAGVAIDESKWYTNLHERGNTGCASILIMLDEFSDTHALHHGEKILCMVPESGRFNTAYMLLTVVDE